VSRWVGRLQRRDLEGGVWTLHTDRGAFALYGDIPRDLAEHRVEVEGEAEEAFGIAMTGPAIAVRRIRKV